MLNKAVRRHSAMSSFRFCLTEVHEELYGSLRISSTQKRRHKTTFTMPLNSLSVFVCFKQQTDKEKLREKT